MKKILNNSRNKLNIGYWAVLLSIFSILCLSMPVYARSVQELYITLPVEQKVSGISDANEFVCEYSFVSLEEGNPMPAGSVDGKYTFTLMGNESAEVGPIVYNESGIYTYEMTQTSTKSNTELKRSEKVYTVMVRVKREDDGGLHGEVIAENNLGYKSEVLKFTNGYLDETESESEDHSESLSESVHTESTDGSGSGSTNGGGSNGKATGAKTGDTTRMMAIILALVLSCSVIIAIFVIGYRRKAFEQNKNK